MRKKELHLQLFLYLLILFCCFFSSCSRNFLPDRSQFLKDGEDVPKVNLSKYKSVQLRPNQNPELAIGMAISGGGSRAANFAMGVMLGLEELEIAGNQNLLKEIDYFSTVSGGGFAGGAYVGALYRHTQSQPDKAFYLRNYIKNDISPALLKSYTGVLVRANFNLPLYFRMVDDGDALEKAIDNHVLGRKKIKKSLRLGDLFIPADSTDLEVRFPMHITNSSVLSSMTIFPFTPDILETYKVNGYTHQMKRIRKAQLNPFDVPHAVGIKASGSFPVLISNTTLESQFHPKRRFLHLIDGAMTDNTGYNTILDILIQDKGNRKVVFIVDADAGGNRYTFSKKEGAINSLKVYTKLASSGLEARRAELNQDLETAQKLHGIYPIIIGFNILIKDNEAPLPDKVNYKKEEQRLIELLKKNIDNIPQQDLQILYEVVTRIGTKYTMRPQEQEILFLTGRKIVRMQMEEIKKALKETKISAP